MNLSERIQAFAALGGRMHSIEEGRKTELFQQAGNFNAWFTPAQCDLAWKGVLKFLVSGQLEAWTKAYNLEPTAPKEVGVVMAGNIPMVGFHDLLSVLISGHKLTAKLSTQDSLLMRFIVEELCAAEPRFREFIQFGERMNNVDAVIATGSDNTSRYFEYYFRNKPHIIRKNRSSCAVLTGSETAADFQALGLDVFSYFGLGCRNVSKFFVPEGYSFTPLLDAWQGYEAVGNHHKYVNNYDYNKSILLVNRVPFFDNGFVLLTENTSIVSPISVVYYESYKDDIDLKEKLEAVENKVQCIASADTDQKIISAIRGIPARSERNVRARRENLAFGTTQKPELSDYADNIDTLRFLESLN